MDQKLIREQLNLKFDKLRLQFGGKCLHCESEFDLQFCHVYPTNVSGSGRGKKKDITILETIYSVIYYCVLSVIENMIKIKKVVRMKTILMTTLTKDTMVYRGKSW